MTTFELIAVIVSLAAVLGYVNARVLRLPSTIGLMALALVGSLVVVGLDAGGVIDSTKIQHVVASADFGRTLLHGMLGLLLFAGALHVDLSDLATNKWPIGALALGSTLMSTALVGIATYLLVSLAGRSLDFIDCLLFGALISPTDPVAVLGILKSAKAPADLAIQIGGESLFNDGIGVVVFVIILEIAGGHAVTVGGGMILFAREALGGALFGFAIGYVSYRLLRSIDVYSVEVLMTLALVLGGYAAAERLHISAPLAIVVAGLVVGNQGRRLGMSDVTRHHVDLFWALIDEILNAVLFLMLGLEATRLKVDSNILVGAALIVPAVLVARFVSVGIPVTLLRARTRFSPHAIKLLTWGGLRGGISVALALSLPDGQARDAILVLTYAVVVWSILVQGLTLTRLVKRLGVVAE
jgi:CPA1 family monovalent cation:H+ antiporter